MARARFSFHLKIAAAIALIALADPLFRLGPVGGWLGGAALAWILALLLARPALRHRSALVPLVVAAGFAVTLIVDPGLLGWSLFWVALSIAALMPGIGRFDDAWRWSLRLAVHALSGSAAPVRDFRHLMRLRPRGGRQSLQTRTLLVALPLAMTGLFLALFANANPLIEQVLRQIRLPGVAEVIFWGIVLVTVWPSLRPMRWARRAASWLPQAEFSGLGLPAASLLLSLILFNAVFALQNGLDLAFLWSGAPLPRGVTLADYAHRGAYPLILTALLAGLFVLVALEPGSPGAADRRIRRLVVLWVAQNLLLVASSILRTLDYVEAYSLTAFRIAALAWMALVAVGLALICWRMLAGRSGTWLINANALAAALVLSAASVADLDAGAAAWNVRHAREVGGRGVALDLCYLANQRDSALLSLIALERMPLSPQFRDRVRYVRSEAMRTLAQEQSDWRSWTWRGQYRLAEARRLLGTDTLAPIPAPPGMVRGCDGALVADPATAPLTEGPSQ